MQSEKSSSGEDSSSSKWALPLVLLAIICLVALIGGIGYIIGSEELKKPGELMETAERKISDLFR
ncbi:hypothetical protein HMPREF2886_18765 [Pseudomonas sp. HMSC066A08]|nr:hypothetical protein HMPREF2886_18765 [Pseudomonas sp. HMSC066A08]